MTLFRVWAPHPGTVSVKVGDSETPLTKDARGWWTGDAEAGPGTDYCFALDGRDAPDPRSAWQPQGIHGRSRLVDHSEFEWTDGNWRGIPISGAIVYELHVGTFTPEGTFDAVVERLDHLVALGIDAVDLMPVAPFPGRHGWGYDGVHCYSVHSGYGGPDGLKRLVDTCHERGIGVIMDVVYNHLGPDGNYLAEFGPYFANHYSTPWGPAINFDGAESDQVRNYFIENALMWLRDFHCDGLRLDAIHAYHDRSATHFLEELATRVESLQGRLGRNLFLIAESDLNDPRVVTQRDAGGYGMDAQWSDDFHHSIHAVMTGERNGYYRDFGRIADIGKALTHAFVYDGRYSEYRHRVHGKAPAGLPGSRFLGYLQSHDQVGNRARGERISHLVGPGLAKIGAALVMTSPFIPIIFQGEEWAATSPFMYFTDHEDPEIGRAASEGRKRDFAAFGWDPSGVPDPQDESTFIRSQLRWEELEEQSHADMLDWYKRLIRLRRELPELRDGRMDLVSARADEKARTLIVERGPITVVCNFGASACEVDVEPGRARVLLSSGKDPQIVGRTITIDPESVTIFSARSE